MRMAGANGSIIDWESESYPVAIDFIIIPFFALFFPFLRLLLDTYVFQKLAKRMMFGKDASLDIGTHANRKKVNKFKESAWKFVYFSSAEILALAVSYNEPWFTNTKYFWVGPGDQVWPDQKLKLKLKGHYMYSAGFYLYSIFALLFWETRRSDFGVSMAHHVATVILLVMSYLFRFARVGSIILALHDACDGFLEIAKISRYSGCEWMSSIFFLLFVISWTILRIIYYPFWILWSTSYEVLLTLNMEKHKVVGPLYYYLFNTLLFCIAVFNVYWWSLMVGMVVDQIKARGKVSDDVRSDSEGEDGHDD
ncbi:ceramide synthase 1 LOH3-like [Mercurialis annua]|uniref:ceramide synthase 1 LOH3-like n=1 Tax=Mercurialis annua TaxID=3986 RepID=UPI00215F9E7B|nr:ceramide synthase 1 LOH3-like [Mercurialis annua]